MKQHQIKLNGKTNGFTRNSFKFISSCIKTVSSGVRSASASVSASITSDSQHLKDQVLWACFDSLELSPSSFKRVLLLGYTNGFQVLDVDDSSTVSELVSKRDDPCTFLQIQPLPAKSEGLEGFRASHPLLLVATGDEAKGPDPTHRRDGFTESQTGHVVSSSTSVRFYSLKSGNYVHVLRFRSAVYMVRCSPRTVAVGLASQIYCFDALTLESKFSVLTYPVPTVGQGMATINIGYGPMDVGPRWLAYASNNPLMANTGRLSPQSLTPSPGVSPSTSPSSGSLVARYAMESSKQLASGLINIGDMGYKTFSKYYQELLPDGSPSSPIAPSSGWKTSKSSSSSPEMDTVGTVIIKDFVSKAIVAQFKAHTSPISALCFDPSGTLLVTASINGNNINIFRIMPSCSQNGLGSCNWSSSHVHLYKLRRGITSAVIQDICFSQYSQWVSIVSSKGTCHIYVLSPFGGECGLQLRNSRVDGPNLVPVLSLPWWSTASPIVTQQSLPDLPPPPPITLYVVSRIRTGNSGWLNTVSTAASSVAGMGSTPSSAISAVFHCSMPSGLEPRRLKNNALEHLLVYSPSGHVIQYELTPSVGLGLETTDIASKNGLETTVHRLSNTQDEELKVKAEPLQWWDVCRREDWPEREEPIKGITSHIKNSSENSDSEDNDSVKKGEETHERYTLYLSKAEVQIDYGKIPTWQNSKIHFSAMNAVTSDKQRSTADNFGGEIEIESIPSFEIEIKRKDLLPVFEHFHKLKADWSNRGGVGRRHQTTVSETHVEEKCSSDVVVYQEPVRNFQHGGQMDVVKPYLTSTQSLNLKNGIKSSSAFPSPLLNQVSLKIGNSDMVISPRGNSFLVNSPSSVRNVSVLTKGVIPKGVQSSNSLGTSEGSNGGSNRSDFSMNGIDGGSVQDRLDLGGYFQEEYCKAAPLNGSHEISEAATDVDSNSSPREKEKFEEDGENDQMLGGIFVFSEEG